MLNAQEGILSMLMVDFGEQSLHQVKFMNACIHLLVLVVLTGQMVTTLHGLLNAMLVMEEIYVTPAYILMASCIQDLISMNV